MWYIVYVVTGSENKTKEFFNDNGFNSFIPYKEKIHSINGQKEIVKKVLFPSYVFVKSDLLYVEFSEKINKLLAKKNYIIKQLRHDLLGTPALSDEEQKVFEKLFDHDNVICHSMGVILNDKVIITEGPLIGYESNIIKINRHKRECTLLIDFLNEQRLITVSLEIVSKI